MKSDKTFKYLYYIPRTKTMMLFYEWQQNLPEQSLQS